MIRSDTIPVPVKGLNVRELGDSIIIINENGDEMHTLDETGSFIWKSIDGATTVQNILNNLCEEFEVEREQAEGDLKKFLSLLHEKKLIET